MLGNPVSPQPLPKKKQDKKRGRLIHSLLIIEPETCLLGFLEEESILYSFKKGEITQKNLKFGE